MPVCRAGAGARGGVTATMTRAQVRANGNGAVLALVEDVADAGAIVAEALPGAEVREQSLVDTDRTLSIAGTCEIRDRAAADGVPNGDARECKGAHGVNSRPTSSRHRIHISPGRCRCRAASSLEGRSAGNTCHRSNPDRTYTCHLACRSREHCSRRCHCSRALQKQALSKNDTTRDCVLKATKTCGVPLEQSSPEKPSTQTH